MVDFAFPIDWQQGVVERWKFVSDVSTAWNGEEQRVALRAAPVVELEAGAFCVGDTAVALAAWLEAHQATAFNVPYWPAGESAPPSLAARMLEPIDSQWITPQLARPTVKVRLENGLAPPAAPVPDSGGVDILTAPYPDFAKPVADSWRRLLEVLDYRTGGIRVLDRSGYGRRRWALEYLLVGGEIDVARTFVWRRKGRVRPALFTAPDGATVLARLDADDIEWRWITPHLCRVSLGVISLPNET